MLQVAVICGSENDYDNVVVDSAMPKIFKEAGVQVRYVGCSAHRNWEEIPGVVRGLDEEGVMVIIAVAGRAAVLAGMIYTILEGSKLVISVPLANPEVPMGLDSLLASATSPPGTSVLGAGVGYNDAMLVTAAESACAVVSLVDEQVRNAFSVYKKRQKAKKPVIPNLEERS